MFSKKLKFISAVTYLAFIFFIIVPDIKAYINSPTKIISYGYDLANQLNDLHHQVLPSTNISRYQYPQYDGVGNRTQMDRALGVNPPATTNYVYNDIYELTGVSGGQTHSFVYDAVGNRTTADSIPYAPNVLNQYSSVNNVTFSYDGNGNLISDGTRTLAYDRENHLLSFTDGVNSATYGYDALNRRVRKTVNSTPTYYVYSGDQIIQDRSAGGSVDAEYVFGRGIDEVLTMDRNNTTYFYHTDGLGSVTEITDSTGAVVENYEYDVYGQPSVTSSLIGNRYMFTGREWDAESGLYHYRWRTYDPKLGNFLQRDPIGYGDGMNMFEYAHNSPTNFVDPDGEFAFLALIPIAYAAIEIGLSASDAYSTGSTLLDPCASGSEKLTSAGLFIAGALAPGGGYSTVGKVGKNLTSRVPNAGGVIRNFTTKSDETFFRVFSKNKAGSFLTKTLPKSKAFAQEALALPPSNQADFIQKVTVPKGTNLQRSRALPAFGRGGGGEQFELLNNILSQNFGPGVPLP